MKYYSALDGVGMVQHFTDFIDRNNFDYKGFKGMELVDTKLELKQRGRLEGLDVKFRRIKFEFNFRCLQHYTGPFTVNFISEMNNWW